MLRQYNESDLLRLAKRFHNTRRTYLLVNPLQGKHLKVGPSDAMGMFHALGEKVGSAFGGTGLVIGFAETATAVGMAVAEEISEACVYIHTTREDIPGEREWIEFQEEHSHAVDQRILASRLREWISDTQSVVFVDDEISTGKTLINFVEQLKARYPELCDKTLIAASILNRVSREDKARMARHGLKEISLLQPGEADYAQMVEKYGIREAEEPRSPEGGCPCEVFHSSIALEDPRRGIVVGSYRRNCEEFAKRLAEEALPKDLRGEVLVLGTEECMYPAICLGMFLERNFHVRVSTHSTTRSPIGICGEEDYPIRNGYKLKSLYHEARDTYLYQVCKYDYAIIVTDSRQCSPAAVESLAMALRQSGNEKILLVRG